MRDDERVAMARVFSDAPLEDVYEVLAVAMNVLEERGEDLVTEGESDSSSLIGDTYTVHFDPVEERWVFSETHPDADT